ncbi:MAG TPA: hypothetical protein VHC69_31675 [Polyangiaceae bacterium]|nr:hypothetical protein [Polyangiaceae bacterium]
MLVGEDRVLGIRLAAELPRAERLPGFERLRDALGESPPARVVGFVLVEADGLVIEVEVAPLQRGRFPSPHPFAVKEPVEHAVRERHLLAREQRAVLLRIQDRESLLRPDLRKPAAWQWVAVDVAGELGEVEHAVDESGVLTTRLA